jgi:hypothetical protein
MIFSSNSRWLSGGICTIGAAGLAIFIVSTGVANADKKGVLGNLSFQTTCDSEANSEFEEGLGLLHHMMYQRAEKKFSSAQTRWPDCGMFHWGVAMSQFKPVRPGQPSDEALLAGRTAVSAMNKIDSLSDLERAFAESATAFYLADTASYRERIRAWANAQKSTYEQFPDNVEAATFYALSLLATAPGSDKEFGQQKRAADLLEEFSKRTQLHPGVYHYLLHANDNRAMYSSGLPYAEKYAEIAPEVSHALHMPAHIFVRTGNWEQVIDWNERSAEAALSQQNGEAVSANYAHAMDYMIYGLLQLGRFEAAEAKLAEFLAIKEWQQNFGSAYALAAAPVRVVLEQEQWMKAASLPATLPGSLSWDKFPQAEAMLWYAKGLGAARIGQNDLATKAVSRLQQLRNLLVEKKQNYWVTLLDTQVLSIQAWKELDKGNPLQAIALQSKAADMEDKIGKSPVTPGHVLPARELLGDIFTQLDDSVNAQASYKEMLVLAPNRRRSMNVAE